jgi:hypothetical protein
MNEHLKNYKSTKQEKNEIIMKKRADSIREQKEHF